MPDARAEMPGTGGVMDMIGLKGSVQRVRSTGYASIAWLEHALLLRADQSRDVSLECNAHAGYQTTSHGAWRSGQRTSESVTQPVQPTTGSARLGGS